MLKNKNKNGERIHYPVLAQEVLECLQPQAGESYLDLTAGYGGHAELVLEKTSAPSKAILVDRDELAMLNLENRFAGTKLIHSDFKSACEQLVERAAQFDLILADLGVSSPHLDVASRGFSFSLSGPLDMRMDQSQLVSAANLVNSASEAELADIISRYGEDPKAKVIARKIIENRPIEDTNTLATVVSKAYGPWARASKVHPATRTFQALRIAVNDELGQLADSLPLMHGLLAPGGRLAIISFHSLEDRMVKLYFSEHAGDRYDTELRILTKKPITASANEIRLNPRARSAKLRAVAKIKK